MLQGFNRRLSSLIVFNCIIFSQNLIKIIEEITNYKINYISDLIFKIDYLFYHNIIVLVLYLTYEFIRFNCSPQVPPGHIKWYIFNSFTET